MRNLVELTILGEPFGKQRPRVITRGKGASRAFTPQKTANYENYIKTLYRQKYGRHTSFKEDDELLLFMCIKRVQNAFCKPYIVWGTRLERR